MPDKMSKESGTSDPEHIPADQGQREKPPADADKGDLEQAEKSLEAVNNAASTARILFFTFLLLGTYIGIIIGSTTDEQLLRVSPVTLPLLNVQLPIRVFYAVVPWLLLLVHFNCLLTFALLARKVRMFDQQAKEVSDYARELRERLDNFPFVQLLAGNHQRHGFMWWLLSIMCVGTIFFFPMLLLLWAQARFLPYHSPVITWIQCIALIADAWLLAVLWPRLILGDNVRIWALPRPLAGALFATICISISMPLFLGKVFAMDLSEEVLTENKLPAWVVNSLRQGNAGEQKKRSEKS
jgi:hypothetical protein